MGHLNLEAQHGATFQPHFYGFMIRNPQNLHTAVLIRDGIRTDSMVPLPSTAHGTHLGEAGFDSLVTFHGDQEIPGGGPIADRKRRLLPPKDTG